MAQGKARVLYIPNERGGGRQRGPRLALAQLLAAGLIKEVEVFSYLWRLESNSNHSTFAELCSVVQQFSPTIVLVQHPAGTGLRNLEWRRLRTLGQFTLIYHEGDAYDKLRKRIPPEMRASAAAANISFSAGASRQLAYLRAAGSKDARWTPSTFNPQDFGSSPIPHHRDYDVLMIANESSSRIPFRSIPGSGQRTRLVRELSRRFGTRFAVYGAGWEGSSAKGRLDYLDQEAAVQSAWITANWDHYPTERKSFSDRLPIALASGTIHVTSAHPGYEEIFPPTTGFLHYERTVKDIVRRIEIILGSADQNELLKTMHAGREFAHANFRQDDNLVELLNAGGAGIEQGLARQAWDISTLPLNQM